MVFEKVLQKKDKLYSTQTNNNQTELARLRSDLEESRQIYQQDTRKLYEENSRLKEQMQSGVSKIVTVVDNKKVAELEDINKNLETEIHGLSQQVNHLGGLLENRDKVIEAHLFEIKQYGGKLKAAEEANERLRKNVEEKDNEDYLEKMKMLEKKVAGLKREVELKDMQIRNQEEMLARRGQSLSGDVLETLSKNRQELLKDSKEMLVGRNAMEREHIEVIEKLKSEKASLEEMLKVKEVTIKRLIQDNQVLLKKMREQ